MRFSLLLLTTTSLVSAAILPITRQGKYLFDSKGARFYVKGVAYQRPGVLATATAQSDANGGFPEPSSYLDPLVDITACTRDIPNFKTLGVNVVRVYSVDPNGDHSACMNALAAASIYVIADLSLPLNGSINRAAPSWNIALLDQYLSILDNLLPYNNLLAVNIGNEVVTQTSNSDSAAYVKAAARDIKAYLNAKSSKVLVAYASADGLTWRQDLAAFLTCGSAALSIDIFGLNSYQWCGASTYTASGNDVTTSEFADLPVAAIFSEYGCVTDTRDWSEVASLFSAPSTSVWSGGIAFEYFADATGYGLTANTTSNDGAITVNSQFTLLAAAYAAITPPTLAMSGVAASVYPACAAPGANIIATSVLPPTPSAKFCSCLDTTAFGCVAGAGITPVIVGALINTACSLLGATGGTCTAIAGSGSTGVYGSVSSCSPTTQLNYVASEYYASQSFAATACSFAGNTTVNTNAPKSASGLASAITACQNGAPASTKVPASPTAVISSGGTASSSAATTTAAVKSGATAQFGVISSSVAMIASSVLLGVMVL